MEEPLTKGRINRRGVYLKSKNSIDSGAYFYPILFPDDYSIVGKALLDLGLKLPNGQQLTCLLDEFYRPETFDFFGSKKQHYRMVDSRKELLVFNTNLWMPKCSKNAGVYVQYDSQARGMSEFLTADKLEEALIWATNEGGVRLSKDGKTAFAPYSTVKLGQNNPEELVRNGFIIASFGLEGVEKLERVSRKFKDYPRVVSRFMHRIMHGDESLPVQSFSKLYGFYQSDNLIISGDELVPQGYAFGVLTSEEFNALKK